MAVENLTTLPVLPKNTGICKTCGTEFKKVKYHSNQVFCSSKCNSRHWDKTHPKSECTSRHGKQRVREFTCDWCSKSFMKRYRVRFCSPECHRSFSSKQQQAENNTNWKGNSVGWYGAHKRAQYWYKLKNCTDCGKPAIDRHHIDGNHLNNSEDNIAFLCRRCHMIRDGRLARLGFI